MSTVLVVAVFEVREDVLLLFVQLIVFLKVLDQVVVVPIPTATQMGWVPLLKQKLFPAQACPAAAHGSSAIFSTEVRKSCITWSIIRTLVFPASRPVTIPISCHGKLGLRSVLSRIKGPPISVSLAKQLIFPTRLLHS